MALIIYKLKNKINDKINIETKRRLSESMINYWKRKKGGV